MGDGLGESLGEVSARAEEQLKQLLDGSGEALALQADDRK